MKFEAWLLKSQNPLVKRKTTKKGASDEEDITDLRRCQDQRVKDGRNRGTSFRPGQCINDDRTHSDSHLHWIALCERGAGSRLFWALYLGH